MYERMVVIKLMTSTHCLPAEEELSSHNERSPLERETVRQNETPSPSAVREALFQ